MKNLRVAIDTLDMLGSPKDARVIVLNRADAKVGLRPDDVVAAIKTPIAVNIPNSLTVPASVNRGVPIVLDDPKGPVARRPARARRRPRPPALRRRAVAETAPAAAQESLQGA